MAILREKVRRLRYPHCSEFGSRLLHLDNFFCNSVEIISEVSGAFTCLEAKDCQVLLSHT